MFFFGNSLGLAFAILSAFVAGVVYRNTDSGVLSALVCGLLLLPDLGIRWTANQKRKKRDRDGTWAFHTEAGGHMALIPVWIIGVGWLLFGVALFGFERTQARPGSDSAGADEGVGQARVNLVIQEVKPFDSDRANLVVKVDNHHGLVFVKAGWDVWKQEPFTGPPTTSREFGPLQPGADYSEKIGFVGIKQRVRVVFYGIDVHGRRYEATTEWAATRI